MTTATATVRSGALIDLIAVERWLAGDDAVALTPAERLVAIHAAHGSGLSINQIARRLGMAEKTVKDRLRERPPVPYAALVRRSVA
jgi:DNA-directed RNA polymerase specialized sigma24 family protein